MRRNGLAVNPRRPSEEHAAANIFCDGRSRTAHAPRSPATRRKPGEVKMIDVSEYQKTADGRIPDHTSESISGEFPVHVWRLMAICYAVLLGAAFIAFTRAGETAYLIFIAIVLALMFFGIPWLLMRTETRHRHEPRRSFFDLLGRGLQAGSGHLEGREAMVQILLIPLVLACGMVVFGLIDVIERV